MYWVITTKTAGLKCVAVRWSGVDYEAWGTNYTRGSLVVSEGALEIATFFQGALEVFFLPLWSNECKQMVCYLPQFFK